MPLPLILLLSILLSFSIIPGEKETTAGNIVKGTVLVPEESGSTGIRRGNKYEDDLEKMSARKKQILEENDPEKHLVVSLHPLDFTPSVMPGDPVKIRQREKTFIPCVTPVTKGTTVYFLNEDEFFHNVYSLTPGSRFNIGRRPSGNSYPQRIKKAGVIKLNCDIHSDMHAVILSLETPYFQKVEAGKPFQFKDIPDGRYRLEVFHLDLKTITRQIELDGNTVIDLKLVFEDKA